MVAFTFVMLNTAALLAPLKAFRSHAELWDNLREMPGADHGVLRDEADDHEPRLLRKACRTSL